MDDEIPADASVVVGRSGSFPWSVLHDRHPALLRQVLATQPYPPAVRRAVQQLAEEIEGPIRPLGPDDPGPDAAAWRARAQPHLGMSWYEVPFLWAENYFYRKLLAATGWFGPGPWRGFDPFGAVKDADLRATDVDGMLAELDALERLGDGERFDVLVLASVWGNRADLGFLLQQESGGAAAGDLLVDDRPVLASILDDGSWPSLALVADNAGRELLPDLLLIDHLLARGTDRVALHVKPRPYFVSDATVADVVDGLRRLVRAEGGAYAPAAGRRLVAAMHDGRLAVRAPEFWVEPAPYAQLPDDLRAELGEAVTIVKGDLNYRRLVGDAHHPATTPFAALTSSLPGPVVALRTLKSEVIVGLSDDTLARLAAEPGWRTSGTHAVIQARA